MCLIVLAYRAHPQFPLIFGGNRDEFFARPTSPADYWSDAPHVLGGRDKVAGGTWFGVTRNGRFAAVTNFRDPAQRHPNPRSRGLLVSEFLRGSIPTNQFAAQLDAERDTYDGFNVLFGDRDSAWYVTNRAANPAIQLAPGVHGLSNHLLDTPWPKVTRAKKAVHSMLALPHEDEIANAMLAALSDRAPVADHELPSTGVSVRWERILATAFISADGYGTRASTVFTLSQAGNALFLERSFDEPQGDRRFEFDVSA